MKELLGLKWRKAPAYTTIRGIIHGVDEQSSEKQYRLYTQDLISRFGHRTVGRKLVAGDGKALRNNHMEDQKPSRFLVFLTRILILFLPMKKLMKKPMRLQCFKSL